MFGVTPFWDLQLKKHVKEQEEARRAELKKMEPPVENRSTGNRPKL